jgi:hypothetical protein
MIFRKDSTLYPRDLDGAERKVDCPRTVRLLNHFLFDKHHFRINVKYPESIGNSFLNRLTETKRGNEYSITLFYAIIAQELGNPLYPVMFPNLPLLAYLDTLLDPMLTWLFLKQKSCFTSIPVRLVLSIVGTISSTIYAKPRTF